MKLLIGRTDLYTQPSYLAQNLPSAYPLNSAIPTVVRSLAVHGIRALSSRDLCVQAHRRLHKMPKASNATEAPHEFDRPCRNGTPARDSRKRRLISMPRRCRLCMLYYVILVIIQPSLLESGPKLLVISSHLGCPHTRHRARFACVVWGFCEKGSCHQRSKPDADHALLGHMTSMTAAKQRDRRVTSSCCAAAYLRLGRLGQMRMQVLPTDLAS